MFEPVGIRPELRTKPKITTVIREGNGGMYPVEKPVAVAEFFGSSLQGLDPQTIVALGPDWAELEALRRAYPNARISGITNRTNEELMTSAKDADVLLLEGDLVNSKANSSVLMGKMGIPDLVVARNADVGVDEGWRVGLPFFAGKISMHGGTLLVSSQTLEEANLAESMLLQGGIRTQSGRLDVYQYFNGYITALGGSTGMLKADSYFMRLGK